MVSKQVDHTDYIQSTIDHIHANGGGEANFKDGEFRVSKLIFVYDDVKISGGHYIFTGNPDELKVDVYKGEWRWGVFTGPPIEPQKDFRRFFFEDGEMKLSEVEDWREARIEEIKEHLEEGSEEGFMYGYPEDVPYLLERVAELEAENERLGEVISRTKKRIYAIVGKYAISLEDNWWLRHHLDEVEDRG
jgi:hypothetical protein